MGEILVGKVTHYFSRLGVAVVELSGRLEVGDRIYIRGHTTDLVQQVISMEVEHHKIQSAEPGTTVAIKVARVVRAGDNVYKLAGEQAFDEQRFAMEPDL